MPVNLLTLTTSVRVKLAQALLSTTATTVYTVPASTDAKITSIVLCNVTATTATATISVVTAAGTAGVANRIVSALPVDPNGIVTLDTPVHMGPGDFINVLGGTASAITATISGETYA